MQTTVSKRGQTAIPARIRQKYNIGSQAKLEWLDASRKKKTEEIGKKTGCKINRLDMF